MKYSRTVLKITGSDSFDFLQGLITNDVSKANEELIYASLLTPQGKFVVDFFIFRIDEAYYLDVHSELTDQLHKHLTLYRLRSKVLFEKTNLNMSRGLTEMPKGAFPDPRHPDLGWRKYSTNSVVNQEVDWDQIRVTYCIPETLIELIPERTYILEAGFERLNGVDFQKGCYVGQEVTARMRHKTQLQKGLARVLIEHEVPLGTEIRSEKRPVGYVYTQSQGYAIAQIRFKQIRNGELKADDSLVRLDDTFQDAMQNNPEPGS